MKYCHVQFYTQRAAHSHTDVIMWECAPISWETDKEIHAASNRLRIYFKLCREHLCCKLLHWTEGVNSLNATDIRSLKKMEKKWKIISWSSSLSISLKLHCYHLDWSYLQSVEYVSYYWVFLLSIFIFLYLGTSAFWHSDNAAQFTKVPESFKRLKIKKQLEVSKTMKFYSPSGVFYFIYFSAFKTKSFTKRK